MQTKLTLRMDSGLIEKAKKWARARNVSLSEAMASFFETLGSRSVSRNNEISQRAGQGAADSSFGDRRDTQSG